MQRWGRILPRLEGLLRFRKLDVTFDVKDRMPIGNAPTPGTGDRQLIGGRESFPTVNENCGWGVQPD